MDVASRPQQGLQSGFERKLALAWPPEKWRDLTALVAVSGGADSVALFRGLAAIRLPGPGRLVIAHYNHGWRGADSDADEQFVVGLAEQFGLAIEVGRSPVGGPRDEEITRRTEEAARCDRYQFFETTAQRLGARYVLTAHTADDQAETILQRIIRGTGLSGLAGMRRARPLGPAATLLRPLLNFRRNEIVEYLESLGQGYQEDASNLDQRFTRNRIRHELIPLLETHYYPGALESLLRLGTLAADAQQAIEHHAAELTDRCVTTAKGALRIDCAVLSVQPRHLIREVAMGSWRAQSWPLAAMGLDQWELLAAMICEDGQPSAPRMFPGGVHARREGQVLVLDRCG